MTPKINHQEVTNQGSMSRDSASPPPDIEQLLKKATQSHENGDLKTCETLCRQILSLEKDQPETLHLLGLIALKKGKLEKASNLVSHAIQKNPENFIYHCTLGEIIGHQKQPDQAMVCFQKASHLSPENPEVYYKTGNFFMDQNDFQNAISYYKKSLSIDPAFSAACFNLGCALQALGKIDDAIICYQTVLKLNPNFPEALYNIAVISQRTGNLDQAVDYYTRLLELNPDWVAVYYNLGNAYQDQGKYADSISCYKKSIALEPESFKTYYNMGKAYQEMGKQVKAIECYQKTLEFQPGFPAAHNNLGKSHAKLGNMNEAIFNFKSAIRIKPRFEEAYFNLGDLYQETGKLDRAIKYYQKAIQIQPDLSAAHNNLGNAFKKLNMFDEAIHQYKILINLQPELAQGYYNLGSTQRLNGEYNKAIKNLNRAIKLKPDYPEAYNNLGLALKNLGDMRGAIKMLSRSIALRPNLSEAHWNLSLILILNGDFKSGWREFEWRFQQHKWKDIYPHKYEAPRWDGSILENQTLFVHDEQGLGDTLQFIRYIPWVKSRCHRVIFETRKSLIGLLKNYPGIDQIIPRSRDGNPGVEFDFYIPLMSLPYLCETNESSIPGNIPYLFAEPEKKEYWKNKLPGSGYKIGIAWAGRPQHPNDHNRSCNLDQFRPLAEISGVRLLGMQKGPGPDQMNNRKEKSWLKNYGEEFEDFTDTAGFIENMDMVITVDTAVAHLAGGMGKPVWVLIPHIPDWRWMLNREDSPWYATMRLFRQNKPGDWEPVFQRITESILSGFKASDLVSEA